MNPSVNILLGELLLQTGMVSKIDLEEALQIGAETGMRVGRVLIVSNFLTEEQLIAALAIQQRLKDGVLSLETGLAALKLVKKSGLNLQEALSQLEVPRSPQWTTVQS